MKENLTWRKSILAGVMSCAVMNVALFSTTAAEEITEFASLKKSISKGERLYNDQGCISCHGKDGKKPAAGIFPKLAGKDSAYLLEQMESIQSGERSGDEAAIMHQQYYSEGAALQACDEPLSQAELKQIADWLASL